MIDPDTGKALVLFELGGWCWDEADPVPEDKDALHHFQFWWKFTDTLAIDVRMTREERDAFAQDIDPDEIQRWCENHPERVINISDPIKDPGDCDCDIEEFED